MPKTPDEFAQTVFAHIGERAGGQDRSFFSKFIQGQLSRDSLRGYYRHLYHECCSFVRLVSLVHALADERDQREAMAANFLEEYCKGVPGKDHPTLAMHVGLCFGLSEEEIEKHGLLPDVKRAFDGLRDIGMRSFVEGLAILTTIEFDLPLRHMAMRQALQKYYGIAEKDLEYYAEHMEGGGVKDAALPGYGGDDVHVARQVKLLAKYACSDEAQERVLSAIDATFSMRSVLVRALDANFGGHA
jgi:pyrroloquinoline quinone (PQQ) biosynthesis protein C